MRPIWRVLTGSALTIVFIAAMVAVDREFLNIPNPSVLLIGASAFVAFFGGPVAGLASAAISIVFALIYFSDPALLQYSPDDQTRILVLSLVTPVIAVMIGVMRNDIRKSIELERERTVEMVALRAALDQIDHGAVLLDHEMRAQFINRAFRRLWNLPDSMAEKKPPFIALMYHGRDTRAYDIPDHQLGDYVADRVARVKAGDTVPLDLKLKSGAVVRFMCTALPDGGRMLTYTHVTDLVRHAEELRTLATVDSLTGLYNRRHFLTLARGEWERYQRYNRPLSLLFIDIDRFKAINDLHGHAAGDSVLASIGRICRDAQRASDTGGRFGGNEFAILLPETDLDGAIVFAERLRQTIERQSISTESENHNITVSIGVADARLSMSGFDRLLKLADNALYEAKQAGRNRVVAAPRQDPQAADHAMAAE